uniref:Uncharacterized protein n=1 Tax=Aegilops tauschii TaxID=37682 RepID=R7WAK8_AEGTA
MVAHLYAVSGKTVPISPTHPADDTSLDMVIPSIGSNNVPVPAPGVGQASTMTTLDVPTSNTKTM